MAGLIISLLVLIGTVVWAAKKEEYEGYVIGLFGGIAIVVMAVFVTILIKGRTLDNTPVALDVYRGKTTLEITYKDSVALDSVVVFKDEFLKK